MYPQGRHPVRSASSSHIYLTAAVLTWFLALLRPSNIPYKAFSTLDAPRQISI